MLPIEALLGSVSSRYKPAKAQRPLCSLPTKALSNYDYYMDTHRLRISVSNMKNANTREQLELIKQTVLRNLSTIDAAPSAQFAPRPPAFVKVGMLPLCCHTRTGRRAGVGSNPKGFHPLVSLSFAQRLS